MCNKLIGALSAVGRLDATLSGVPSLTATLSLPQAVAVDEYSGPYEFTPGAAPQVVEIANKKATDNITINPIPQNYGLITWDGATLTVS